MSTYANMTIMPIENYNNTWDFILPQIHNNFNISELELQTHPLLVGRSPDGSTWTCKIVINDIFSIQLVSSDTVLYTIHPSNVSDIVKKPIKHIGDVYGIPINFPPINLQGQYWLRVNFNNRPVVPFWLSLNTLS